MSGDPRSTAADLLAREGLHLDKREWSAWLDLYDERAVYRVPAWRDENEETQDPDREISLIYHDSRLGLEERVRRLQSGKSVTTFPLVRTTHLVANVVAAQSADGSIAAEASWSVHVYQPRTARQSVNFGRYEVLLARRGDGWRIAAKTIHLLNDRVTTLLDFYTL